MTMVTAIERQGRNQNAFVAGVAFFLLAAAGLFLSIAQHNYTIPSNEVLFKETLFPWAFGVFLLSAACFSDLLSDGSREKARAMLLVLFATVFGAAFLLQILPTIIAHQ